MYLLLGGTEDPCCAGVARALGAQNWPVQVLSHPFAEPIRMAWRLDNHRCKSWLSSDHDPPIDDTQLAGVLVRTTGWVDPQDWKLEDLAYTRAENQAALLGWLWSLECPVIGRLPAAIWVQPWLALSYWRLLLEGSGLPVLESLVTNVEHEARSFASRCGEGAVYSPLTTDGCYLVASEREWTGLAAMQRHAPVSLSAPHGSPLYACVVGEKVIWQRPPEAAVRRIEESLRRFATTAGLSFVGVALAPTPRGLRIVGVEPLPRLERFSELVRDQIVTGLMLLLTAGRGKEGCRTGEVMAERHAGGLSSPREER